MKTLVSSALLIGLTAMAPAMAQNAKLVTEERTSVYAGPNDDYPRVATVPAKRTVQVYGCLPGREWCDVWVNGVRGWVESDDLVYWRNNRASDVQRYDGWYRYPTVTFSLGSYWDTNYRRQAWYGERDHYERRWRDDRRDYDRRDWDRDRRWRNDQDRRDYEERRERERDWR